MTDNKKLIERLRAVIDTATSDSMLVENDRVVTNAEHDACRAERDEAEAVRDLIIAALTPTDDEREALVAILEAPLTEESQGRTFSEMLADVILVRFSFRRTEVPEPSVEDCPDAEGLVALRSNGSEPQGEPSEHRDRIALAEFIDKALDGDAGYGVGEFLAGGILSFLSERTALHAAFEPQGEPSDAHLSNVSIDGVQQSWKQLYEREHEQHLALQGYRRMLSDLDRNASGRHEGDYDSHATGNGGISAGNPHLTTGQIIGYDIGGREYVVPEPRDRGTLSAWVRAAGEAGGEGR